MLSKPLLVTLLLSVSFSLSAQGHERGNHPYVIRGEVSVDFEFIYAGHVDDGYPLDVAAASRRALEEAALFYSGMIYGWAFNYEIGERARQIEENIEMENVALVRFGDPALRVTDTDINNIRLRVWTDFHLNESQRLRMEGWRAGMIRNAQGTGYGPSFLEENPGWIAVKQMAIEDAARSALRAMLRSGERNRPKEVTGFLSLASFPRFYMDAGRMAAACRFRVQITEIIPFAVH